jgi:putative membrane protein
MTKNWTAPVFFELDAVENSEGEETTIILNYTAPVVLPEEVTLETRTLLLAHDTEAIPPEARNTNGLHRKVNTVPQRIPGYTVSPWWWLVGSLGTLLVSLLIMDTYRFIAQQYVNGLFFGTFFLLLTLTIVTAIIILSWRSYENFRQLRTISELQREGHLLIETNRYGDAIHYINRIAHYYMYRPDIRARLDRFYVMLNDSHHDREVCTLFSTYVMKEIDQQAYRVVEQRAKETALLVMVSPIPLLDTLFTLWRNLRMIRDIATLYGGRPSFFASASLVKSVVQNLIYADVSEILAESVADAFGNSVLSVVSTQAAQGVGSGILTARVGLQAMALCRPLPFQAEEKPRLKEIRWEIITSLKGFFENKENKKTKTKKAI